MNRIANGIAVGTALVILGGCVVSAQPVPVETTYSSTTVTPGSYSETVTVDSAPPDATWAYYPDTDVYYSTNRSVYYYHDGGRWVYSRQAPAHVHAGALGGSVTVTYVGGRPYEHYDEHRRGHGNGPGHDNGRGPGHDNGRGSDHDNGRGSDHDNNGRGRH